MADFQFECRSVKSEPENLMAEANAEDRFFTHQIAHCFVRVGKSGRIAGAVGKKNSVRLKREHLSGGCRCRNNGNAESSLAQQPQNVLFDPVIVSGDAKSDPWKRRLIRLV